MIVLFHKNRLKLSTGCFISAISILFFLACGARHGSITIITYPVNGNVYADGELYGVSPVSISLPYGDHEISFSEYSTQYSIPSTQTIRVDNLKKTEIIGIYKNIFIPEKPPLGFSPADSIRIYGTSERELKDGTIFDYINGGGLVYLNHGLRETTHMVYLDDSGKSLTVDIFEMGTIENARAAFNDEEICPSGFITYKIGEGCKAYNYEPDFFLNFYKSKYLVYVGTNNDNLRNTVETYAKMISAAIPE